MAGKDDNTAATRGVEEGASAPRGKRAKAELSGRTLAGRYLLGREIGEGGFGVVFEGEDKRLQKRIAVKVLSPTVAENTDALARFKQEATAAARIGHKYIVDVTDIDEDEDGTHFMVMEYIEGACLSAVIRDEAPLPPARALAIVARMAQALAAAHSRSIIHRDLKPANVLLTSVGPVTDFVKILDFGISKVVKLDNADETLTSAGQVVGTPRYMAPEQGIGNKPVDRRADVYALGTMLYEMVTGQAPFSGATQYEIIHNKVSHDPIPPSVVRPELEPATDLDRLILRALAREPEDRYPDMTALGTEVIEILDRVDPAMASGVRPVEPTPRGLVAPKRAGDDSLATKLMRGAAATPSKSGHVTATQTAQTPREKPQTRRPLFAIAAAVAAVTVVAFVLLRGDGKPAGAPAPPPAPAPVAAKEPPAPAEPPEPETVEIRLELTPSDAVVEIGGVGVTENPLVLPLSDEPLEVVIRAPGHQSERREIRPMTSGELEVKLAPDEVESPHQRRRRQQPDRLPDSPL